MMSATVLLASGSAIALDALPGLSPNAPRRGLLSLEGPRQGQATSCVLLQLEEVGILIAHLELLRRALERP